MVKANEVILKGAIEITPADLLGLSRKAGAGATERFIRSLIESGIVKAVINGAEVDGKLAYIFIGYMTIHIIIRAEIGTVQIIYTE